MKNKSHPIYGERSRTTSWQKVAPWYNKITGEGGHYYHQHVVIPGVLRLLGLQPNGIKHIASYKLLDVACGNGVLGKAIPPSIEYLGIDLAPSLILEAKKTDHNPKHKYIVGDVTENLSFRSLGEGGFTHAAIILALQNISDPFSVLKNVSELLIINSQLLIVLNHPAFRIPRQSSWGIDANTKMQYRRIDRYMSPMEIPITAHPGERFSPNTLSYHFPISAYSKMLSQAGFVIELIEEWTSDKESLGRNGRMENRARQEFPLFMTIKCIKISPELNIKR
ncbi:MAG TPA: methyltransferase [Alphaproteobacteria bacterium]|jgi:hypothetical protein|nr:methyltransferase [Alphaproteobacteria bacterium]